MEYVRRGTTKRRHTSNAVAITNRIEGSKAVLDALERAKNDEDIAFLKPAAESAIAILYSIRAIREGEVDEDFAGLALDACGLVFILINECHKILQVGDQIPERLKWGSDELAAYLRDDVHIFVRKKIKRGFLKKHLMQAVDDEKVLISRDILWKWTTKLEIKGDASIHDTVEAIISEKVSKHDQDAQATRYARDGRQRQNENQSAVHRAASYTTIQSSAEGSISEPSANKALPEIRIYDSNDSEDKNGKATMVGSRAIRSGLELAPLTEKENETRQKKREMERQAKKAEREKWRRSEQEFCRLPYMPIQEDLRSVNMRRSAEDLRSGPSGEISFHQGYQKPMSTYDEKRDMELATELQAKLAREIEEEDERKALAIGIALHRQWEAENEASQVGSSQSSLHDRKHLTMTADSQYPATDLDSNSWNMAYRRRSASSIARTSPSTSREPTLKES